MRGRPARASSWAAWWAAETVIVRTLTIGDELYRQAAVAIYADVAVPGFPKALVGMAAFEDRRVVLDLRGPAPVRRTADADHGRGLTD